MSSERKKDGKGGGENEGRKRKQIVTGSNNDVQSKGVELNCVQSITIRNAKGGKKKPLPATSPKPRVKESGKSSQIATEEMKKLTIKEKNRGSKEVKTEQSAVSKKVKKNSKTMDKDRTMPESKTSTFLLIL